MHKLKITVLLSLCLFICSCDELPTSYGTTHEKSINGVNILKQEWTQTFDLNFQRNRKPSLSNYDLLIHVVRSYDFRLHDPLDSGHIDDLHDETEEHTYDFDEDLEYIEEDEEIETFSSWLATWLSEGSNKQFVLILRDGNIAPQLCDEWAQECDLAASQSSDEKDIATYTEQAKLLRKRAKYNRHSPLVSNGDHIDYHWFKVFGRATQDKTNLSGIYDGPAPHTFFSRSNISADNGETLLTVNEDAYAIHIPVGKNRLIVIANATPLLDAALVDPAARKVLHSLSDSIMEWKPKKGAWMHTLAGSNSNPPPQQNILLKLFTKEPFNYMIIHALILLAFYLFWRACWLGRKQSQRHAVEEDFERHVNALAFHLRREQQQAEQCQAIAHYTGKDTQDDSDIGNTDEDAIRYLQHIYAQTEHQQSKPKD